MPAPSTAPKRPVLLLAAAAIVLIGGGAALLMQGGSDETAGKPAPVSNSAAQADPTPPEFHDAAPPGAESQPLEARPSTLPGAQEPIVVAAGDPTGGLSGTVDDDEIGRAHV